MKFLIVITTMLFMVTTMNDVVKADDDPPAFFPKTTVVVVNKLEGKSRLTLHCKSKDDDLGVKVLGYNQEYSFKFRPKPFIWPGTLFFCSFQWPNGGGIHWFDIYVQTRDEIECTVCIWNIESHGPCTYNDRTEKYDLCYGWNKKL
ncbi:S-protein homolog 4 [Linum grandiflorum]